MQVGLLCAQSKDNASKKPVIGQKSLLNKDEKDQYSFTSNKQDMKKRNSISFGFEPVTVTTVLALIAQGLIYGMVAATAYLALLIGGFYAVDKISEAVKARRERRKEKLKTEILKDMTEIQKRNAQLKEKDIAKLYTGKLERVSIPISKDGNEVGLNKVIGFDLLKYGLAKKVLMPLCDVMDGKNAQGAVPNGVCFFGPAGTGKTYVAQALCEHYQEKGGYFEELKFSSNDQQDIKYLDDVFADAEKKFIESGKKKYTVVLLDEIEKYDKPNHKDRTTHLLKLTNNCKDRGVIFVTTTNKLNQIEPALLRDGRTDLRIPVGHIEDFDLADMINYNLIKHDIPHEEIDYKKILDAVKTEKLSYKPKEIEYRLNYDASYIRDYGGYMTTESIKSALVDADVEFNDAEYKQYEDDKQAAKKLGGIYEY